MKILAVSQNGNMDGGANRSFIDVLRILHNDYKVTIDVLVPSKGEVGDLATQEGIRVYVYKYFPNSLVSKKDIKDIYRYLKFFILDIKLKLIASDIKKSLISKRYDLIYINDSANGVGYYLAREMRIPYIWHLRNYREYVHKYILNESILRLGTNGRCIAISRAMQKFMIDERHIRREAIPIIYNGVINHNIQRTKKWHARLHDTIQILQCGTILAAKCQDEAIKAINILIKKGYKVTLNIVGPIEDIVYYNKLTRLISELEIENYVVFAGKVSDMASYRANMDIELMCSKAEAFGRVTVEGMQAGLVVIGANTGGTKEIITDGHDGLLYNHGDSNDLAKKIEKIINDHAYADMLSENAIITTTQKFTMATNVKEIYDLMLKTCNEMHGKKY